jgi:signal transduction histidine kinase
LTNESEGAASGFFSSHRAHVVALVGAPEALQEWLVMVLSDAAHVLTNPKSVESAELIVAYVGDVPKEALAHLRRRARSDAAIVVIVEGSGLLAEEALEAGAFAAIRTPVRAEELRALVTSAMSVHSTRPPMGDATKRDREAYLQRLSKGFAHEIANPLLILDWNVDAARRGSQALSEARALLVALASASDAERAAVVDRARTYLDTTPDPEVDEALEDAVSAVGRMKKMLAATKELLRGGACPITPTNLGDVARSVVVQMKGEPFDGVTIESVVEGDLAVMGDATRIRQIVLHLARNAAQASRHLASPRVRVHVYARGDTGIVSVRDNGRGIAEDMQMKIFEPFHTTWRAEGCVGLGLALSREYATQMGATLSVWSSPGRGSCFRLRMKLASRWSGA